jgi:O6-methylguanine-DNA--protein-cysteine methyltransferase
MAKPSIATGMRISRKKEVTKITSNNVPLVTPFQHKVYELCKQIPKGSYSQTT